MRIVDYVLACHLHDPAVNRVLAELPLDVRDSAVPDPGVEITLLLVVQAETAVTVTARSCDRLSMAGLLPGSIWCCAETLDSARRKPQLTRRVVSAWQVFAAVGVR